MNRLTTFLGRFCVLAALIPAPWANVGVDARNFRILLYLTLAGGIFALASLWTTPRRERRTNSYWGTIATAVPLALGLALVVAQFTPLADETLARVSPRVLELKAELLPPDFDAATETPPLDAFADPEFRAPALLDEAEEAALRESLSESFPFDPTSPLDLQSATAVDAAVERAFLPADAPARNAWGRTISVYPLATREQFLVFGAATLLFLAAAVLFNTNGSRRFLWGAIALNGLAFALFCLAGKLNPALYENETIVDWLNNKRFTPFETLWSDETTRSTAELDERFERDRHYGTYVCRNAAAGYLGLCLAPVVGLIVLAFLKTARLLDKERAGRKRERAEAERWSDVYETRRDAVWKRALGDFFDLFNRRLVVWLGVAGLILGAIFASLSRGGSIAALVGLTGAFCVLAIRKEGRRYWPALAASVAVALSFLAWNGMTQRFDARMSPLVEEDETGQTALESDARWQNWSDAVEAWRDYPWFGSGLGTYRIADYRYDEALKRDSLFYYAENSFIQTRLEMGRVGVLLYVLTYVALIIGVGRLVVGKRSRETLAVGCVGISLILGQFIASMGDFGIYFTANVFLFAALCGSCVARKNVRKWEKLEAARGSSDPAARTQALRDERRATRRELVGAAVWSALTVGLLLGGRWALAESADAVERARLLNERDEIKAWIANSGATRGSKKDETTFFTLPSSATLDAALDAGRDFVERRDDSYELRAALAYLEAARFRVLQFEALRETEKDFSDEELWALTAPEYWTAPLRHYRRLGYDGAAASIRSKGGFGDAYARVLADWTTARRVCPLEPAPHVRIAEALAASTPIAWSREREAVELAARRVAAAAPFDSRYLFNAGRELFRVDAETLWPKFWRRTADFSNEYWLKALIALEAAVPASKQGTLLAEIAPNDPRKARAALTYFYSKRKESAPFFELLLANARTVFEGTPEEARDAAYYFERASFNKFSENYEAAEADFRKALELRPGAIDVELQLAILLCEQTRLLQKDEECVKLLQRARAVATGGLARQAEVWTPRAERNLARSRARAKLAEREREGDSEKQERANDEPSDAFENLAEPISETTSEPTE